MAGFGTKVASLYAEIGADTSKLKRGLDETDKGLTKSALNMKKLVSVGAAVGGVALTVGAAMKKAADDTLKYALEVDDLARSLGATPQQASKLIQVADDVGVSYGQLTSALEAGIRKGIKPTVENLSALSDEYLSIQPGIERTEFLMKNFGRTGNDIARIMELGSEKITEMGDSIEGTARLMDGEAIAAAKEYRDSLDDLGDSYEDLKLTIGQAIIPALSDGIDKTVEYIGTINEWTVALGLLKKEYDGGRMTYDEFIRRTFMLGSESQKTSDVIYEFQTRLDNSEATRTAYYIGMGNIAEGQRRVAVTGEQAGGELVKAWHEAEAAIDGAAGATDKFVKGAVGVWDAAERAAQNAKNAVDEYYAAIDTGIGSQIENQLEALEFKMAGGSTLGAISERINQAIVNKEITDQQGYDYLGGLFVAEQSLQVELDNIDAEQAAQNISSSLNVSLEEADRLLASAQDRTAYLNGLTMSLTIDVAVTGAGAALLLEGGLGTGGNITIGGGGVSGNTSSTPGAVPFEAAGGPVMGGHPYIVGEMGPELFVPSVSGRILSNQQSQGAGGINISGGMNITLPNVTNGAQFQREIESWFNEFVRKNRNSGAYMAGA